MLGPARGILHEEPNAVILHVGVCEGRGPRGYGAPTRARSWKRRIQPRGYLRPRLVLSYSDPIVASVSASHTLVEIGAERRVAIGDVATIFDAQDGSRPEDLAAASKSSVYDLTMHLHALLPRHVNG
jgi:hypothetical protein